MKRGENLPKGITLIKKDDCGGKYDYGYHYAFDFYINAERNRVVKNTLEEILEVKKCFDSALPSKSTGDDTANRLFLSFIKSEIPEIYEELKRRFRDEVRHGCVFANVERKHKGRPKHDEK